MSPRLALSLQDIRKKSKHGIGMYNKYGNKRNFQISIPRAFMYAQYNKLFGIN